MKGWPLFVGVWLVTAGCLIERDLLLPYDGSTPQSLDDGWAVAAPQDVGFDAEALDAVFRGVHKGSLWQLRSLLVFRDGQLVAESYLRDRADVTAKRAIWSCTKQFVGVAVGIAIDSGVLDGVDEPLTSCFAEVASRYPDKKAITLKHLLEMRSGIAYSNDGADGQTSQMLRQLPDDSLAFILGLPTNAAPGTVSEYHDGNPHLLSGCLQRKLGQPLDEWADEVLMAPIGLRNYTWRRYRDGSTLGAFGIETSPREMAKLGQLVLDEGQWRGEQIVSAEWIAEMTADRVESYDDRYGFGYQWWTHRELDLSFMNGHGGQYVFIDRPTRTLVVMTAEPNTQGEHQVDVHEAIEIVKDVLAAG